MDPGLEIPRYYERYRLLARLPRWQRSWRPRRRVAAAEPTPAPTQAVTAMQLATGTVAPEAEPPPPVTERLVEQRTGPVEPEVHCRCGFTIGHPFVRPHCEFTGGGWLLITLGVNAPPRAVRLQCAHCGEVLRRITDPEEIRGMQW